MEMNLMTDSRVGERISFERIQSGFVEGVEVDDKKLSYCPKCKQDVVFKKESDTPPLFILANFVIMMGIVIRTVMYCTNYFKIKKLSNEVRSELSKENYLTNPKLVKLYCEKCKYVIYSSVTASDGIWVLMAFFFLVIIVVMFIVLISK